MQGRRAETWRDATKTGTRPGGTRLIAHYLTDLAVSVGVVVLLGWCLRAPAGDQHFRDGLISQNDIYIAVSRFTPGNLITSYKASIQHVTQYLFLGYDPTDRYRASNGQAFTSVLLLAVELAWAVPRTLYRLYSETDGIASWFVMAGFGAAIATMLVWLFAARTSWWRLFVALALSPIAISVLFTMLQAFMVLMLGGCFWLAALAPYAIACPVLCATYWIIFPNVDYGATSMVLRAIGRVSRHRH
jgi:hypothetical protein